MELKVVSDEHFEPLVTVFPDIPANHDDLKFATFDHESNKPRPAKRARIVVAESSNMEYVGDTRSSKSLCRYAVAVYDKSSDSLTVLPSDQVHVAAVVKSRKTYKPERINQKSALARNALGEAFGTLKKKQAIRALERNKVHASTLTGVESVLKNTIDKSSEALPSQEALKLEQDQNRPIPPFNIKATTAADVYNVEDILPENDMKLIPYKKLLDIMMKNDLKIELAKFDVVSWVLDQIYNVLHASKDIDRLKKLLYLAYMMKLYRVHEAALNRPNGLSSIFPDVPLQLTEKLVSRFTESHENNGKVSRKFPQRLKDKLLGYIFCLCLILSDYKVDPTHLASDLSLPINKAVAMFKELGCKVDTKKTDGNDARKVATLVVPLTFPIRRK
ncbi:DNA-directed RNA polymerase I subunit rpa49 [Chytridiales sp. JEL 0842]|nr:DNA-directed RNA polymerase I subunit rpa49 [Chytridiales sp. JEL 0842]